MPGASEAATSFGTVPVDRVLAAVGGHRAEAGRAGQHLDHALVRIQQRGRVVHRAGQRGRHLAEPAGRALQVEVPADEDELDLEQLAELDDRALALRVTGAGQVAFRALHDHARQRAR